MQYGYEKKISFPLLINLKPDRDRWDFYAMSYFVRLKKMFSDY